MADMPKTIKAIIAAVLILAMFCTTAFASGSITPQSTIVDQGQEGNMRLTIYKNNPEESVPFQVNNMFPGDTETKRYLLAVSYLGTVTVHFHADIEPGYEKLAEVLKCRVFLKTTDELIYDGLMKNMPESLEHKLESKRKTTDELEYEIAVYLETSVGNEYMNKALVADFRWWAVEETSSSGGDDDNDDDSDGPMKPTKEPAHDTITDQTAASGNEEEFIPGQLVTPPKTGDQSLLPIIATAAAAVIALLVLLLGRRRKEEAEDEE